MLNEARVRKRCGCELAHNRIIGTVHTQASRDRDSRPCSQSDTGITALARFCRSLWTPRPMAATSPPCRQGSTAAPARPCTASAWLALAVAATCMLETDCGRHL